MKKFLALLLTVAMVFAMAACSAPAAEETKPAEEGTAAPAEETSEQPAASGSVYYLNFKPEADAAWQELAKKYTELTGVPVKVVTAASGDYQTTLTSEMDKSEAPTLFQCGNQGALNTWGEYCLDLKDTDFYKEMTTDDFNLFGENGEVLAAGYCYEAFGIIVNKALLEKAGHSIDEITNFETLRLSPMIYMPVLPSWALTPSAPPALTAPPPGGSPATLPICLCSTSSVMTT